MFQNRSGMLGGMPPVTLNLIIITTICFLVQVLFGRVITTYLGLHYFASDNFYFHQILTYMFMHGDFMHLFFNMFAVFMFGRTLEIVWGPSRFLFFYVITAVGAALLNILITYLRIQSLEAQIPPEIIAKIYTEGLGLLDSGRNYVDPAMGTLNLLINTPMIGASGAVYGILVAFGMLFPNTELFIIPIPFPIKAKYLVVALGIIALVLGIYNREGDNVAHFAHLGGLLTGFIIVLFWKKQNKSNGRFY